MPDPWGGRFYNPSTAPPREARSGARPGTSGTEGPLEIRPTVGRRLQATVLGLVPGLAHIYVLDRPGTGLFWFVLFVLGAFAAVTGRFLLEESFSADLFGGGILAAAGAWLVSYLDMVRITLLRNYEKRAETRARLAKEGVHLFAAGDLEGARRAFRRCLSLDPKDSDVLFWYGCVEARRGKGRRARRAFRRCARHDLEGKWIWERERAEEGIGG